MHTLPGVSSWEPAGRERPLGSGQVPRWARVRTLSGGRRLVSSPDSESGTPPAEEAQVDHRAESTFGRRTRHGAPVEGSNPHPSPRGAGSGAEDSHAPR